MMKDDDSKEKSDVLVATVESDVADDYTFARETLRELTRLGLDNAKRLAEIVGQSEDIRSYEALSALLKNTGDTTDKLISLQRNMLEMLLSLESQISKGGETEQIMFEGTATDLQKILKTTGDD